MPSQEAVDAMKKILRLELARKAHAVVTQFDEPDVYAGDASGEGPNFVGVDDYTLLLLAYKEQLVLHREVLVMNREISVKVDALYEKVVGKVRG